MKNIILFLLVFCISINSQTKTITGYVVDHEGLPWSGQNIALFDGEELIAQTSITNGEFSFNSVLVGVEDNTVPCDFTLFQNYPNPFNPSTVINYSLNKESHVQLEIFDILGNRIKRLVDEVKSAGDYNVSWYADNESGRGVSAGVYIYRLTSGNQSDTKKMILLDGAGSFSSAGFINRTKKKLGKINSGYRLVITGDDVLTTEIEDIILAGNDPVALNTSSTPYVALAKPIVEAFVYDLMTKYNSNKQLQEPTGIANMKVFLGSDQTQYAYTNENGIAIFKVDKKGIDSIFVTGQTAADTTYYFWGKGTNFDLQPETNKITGFNDEKGIALFERSSDENTGKSLLQKMNEYIDPDGFFPHIPEWSGCFPGFKDNIVGVFLNRDIQPEAWCADSAFAGLKRIEAGPRTYVEITEWNEEGIFVRYDHYTSGQCILTGLEYDEKGPYTKSIEILISGPPSVLLPKKYFSAVTAHEGIHAEIAGAGEHSEDPIDLFNQDVTIRIDAYGINPTIAEKKVLEVKNTLQRNFKLLEYFEK